MRIEGQRARNGRGLPAGNRPQRWGALVTGGWTPRFARMRYVVTGLAPARIEVRSSMGLDSDKHPDFEISDALPCVSDKQAPAAHTGRRYDDHRTTRRIY
jgi:hypothetical protein